MTESTYALHVHSMPFERKPGIREVGSISKTIISEAVDVTQRQLAELVGKEGHTMVLATMNGDRKAENMIQQKVVAIDFDNTENRTDENGLIIKDEKGKAKKFRTEGDKYTSINDALNDDFIKNNASFIYKTFSHQDDWERFRVVFFLDKPLVNNKQVEMLYKWLMKKYPNADPANKDSSRLFYGGTEYIEIGFGNELKTAQVTFEKKEVQTQGEASKSATSEPINGKKNSVSKLNNEEAIQMMEGYLQREHEHLQDYNNALSAIWVIAKAARMGEISKPVAIDFCKMIALGNDEWAENNLVKYKEAMNKPIHDIKTPYTFAQKFGGLSKEPTIDPNDIIATSKYLVDALEIKLYKNRLFFKTGNHWVTEDNKLLRAVDNYVELKRTQDTELIAQFMKRAELIEEEIFPLQFRNSFMLDDGKIIPHSSEDFTPYLLDVDYDPDAYNQDVDDFLDFLTCGRKDLRNVIEEMFGHVLMLQGFPHKVFFYIGEKGSNGKSTFLEMLNSFVGDLGSNIGLENFNDPTSVGELEGKLVNIGDDIDASFLEKSMNFKTLASGNTIMIRPIYQRPYRLKNRATLIFTANDMPTFKDKTGGISRRLVIIPCDNEVKKADFKIDEKLSTDSAKSYLLNLALKGLARIQRNGGKLSESKTINNMVEDYITESDSVLSFLKEEGVNEELPQAEVYEDYKVHCDSNGQKPFSQSKFTQRLKAKGYDKVQKQVMGKRFWRYQKA